MFERLLRRPALLAASAPMLFAAGHGALAAAPAASTLKMIYQASDFPSNTQLLPPLPVAYGQVISGSQSQGVIGGQNIGNGTLFVLTPGAKGSWTKTVLHTFAPTADPHAPDGGTPDRDLVADRAGNVWGTTASFGANGTGTLYELVKPAAKGGAWTYRFVLALPAFTTSNGGSDGLAFDIKGDLFGISTTGCNATGCGDFWEAPSPRLHGGKAPVKLLGVAPASLGAAPEGLAIDAGGNLYGTTYGGGSTSATEYGTVWALSSAGGGTYNFSIIHSFCGMLDSYNMCVDGYNLSGGVTFSQGSLYGATGYGGAANVVVNPASGQPFAFGGNGVVFSLTPPAAAGGAWTFTPLHELVDWASWNTPGPDYGVHNPQGAPAISSKGQLLVATQTGGVLSSAGNRIYGAITSTDKTSGTEIVLNNAFAAENGTLRSGPVLDLNNPRPVHRDVLNRVFGVGVGTFDASCDCTHYWQNLYLVTQ